MACGKWRICKKNLKTKPVFTDDDEMSFLKTTSHMTIGIPCAKVLKKNKFAKKKKLKFPMKQKLKAAKNSCHCFLGKFFNL